MGGSPYLAGSPTISLADLHAAPMFIYLRMTPEGDDLLSRRYIRLGKWLDALQTRASIAATRSPLEQRAT
jgi:glutathione S-transferase